MKGPTITAFQVAIIVGLGVQALMLLCGVMYTPAGTPLAGIWVWVSIWSRRASRMLVPAGMASDEV